MSNTTTTTQKAAPFTREQVIFFLRFSPCKIRFTKKDGTERTLHATLDPKRLPPRTQEETETPTTDVAKKVKIKNPNTIAAFDIDNEGWRSFNLDSIIDIVTDGARIS